MIAEENNNEDMQEMIYMKGVQCAIVGTSQTGKKSSDDRKSGDEEKLEDENEQND